MGREPDASGRLVIAMQAVGLVSFLSHTCRALQQKPRLKRFRLKRNETLLTRSERPASNGQISHHFLAAFNMIHRPHGWIILSALDYIRRQFDVARLLYDRSL